MAQKPRANRFTGSFAVPPPSAVIEASSELSGRLRDEGLNSRGWAYESTALEWNLMLAGQRAHADNPVRVDLQVHLDYWTAVNRIRTGTKRGERQTIAAFETEDLAVCPTEEFFSRAAMIDGLSGHEIVDLKESDEHRDRLVASNCRLIHARITRSSFGTVDLKQSSLIDVELTGLELGSLQAEDLGGYAVRLDMSVAGKVSFARSTLRESRITLRAPPGEADFSWTDLTTNGTQQQLELLALAAEEEVCVHQGPEAGAATFDACLLPGAAFQRAFLQRVTFSQCDLSGADFSGANLAGASFEDCDLSRATFGRHPREAGKQEPRDANVEGTRFDATCVLQAVDWEHSVGTPEGRDDLPRRGGAG